MSNQVMLGKEAFVSNVMKALGDKPELLSHVEHVYATGTAFIKSRAEFCKAVFLLVQASGLSQEKVIAAISVTAELPSRVEMMRVYNEGSARIAAPEIVQLTSDSNKLSAIGHLVSSKIDPKAIKSFLSSSTTDAAGKAVIIADLKRDKFTEALRNEFSQAYSGNTAARPKTAMDKSEKQMLKLRAAITEAFSNIDSFPEYVRAPLITLVRVLNDHGGRAHETTKPEAVVA